MTDPQTDPHERFHLGHLVFDVTMARYLLAAHGPGEVRTAATSSLTGLLGFIGVWPEEAALLPDEALDAPLIAVMRQDDGTQNWRVLIIDGYHRIWAANDRGREQLTIHILSPEHSGLIESVRP